MKREDLESRSLLHITDEMIQPRDLAMDFNAICLVPERISIFQICGAQVQSLYGRALGKQRPDFSGLRAATLEPQEYKRQ